MEQTHSDNIQIIEKEWVVKNTDALITNKKWLALVVMVADCVPIIYYDPTNNVIAVTHAWRKWTFLEIATKTVKKMQKNFWTKTKELLVSIWPSIWGCCYEIYEKTAQEFINKFWKDNVLKNTNKYFLDLAETNTKQLLNIWVLKENIENLNICNCCNNDYFSYKRDNQKTWRFWGVTCLT